MLIIEYNNDILNGGFGDRIVGLISLKTISTFLNTSFYIKWDKENIKNVVNYSKYNYYNYNIKNVKKHNIMTPNINMLKEWVNNNYFNNNLILNLNYDISHLFLKDNNYKLMINEYEKLYSDIFIIKDDIMDIINNITKDKNITGIQLRAGDHWIGAGDIVENHYNDMNKIYKVLEDIYKYSNNDNYYYLSSDIDLKNIGKEIFGNKLLYCDIKPTHLDRNPDENSMKKIIIDNYILSQKTETIYISEYSNFGKVAVLSGNHKNIYNTKLQKINKYYIYRRIFKGL
jgi:hypothetical protein